MVGLNCHFDPMTTLDAMQLMKDALDEANLKVHLMCQPLAFNTPDVSKQGFIDLPEFPFGELYFFINVKRHFIHILLRVFV